MTIKEQLAALATEGQSIREKAANHPSRFTDADAKRAEEVVAEHARLKAIQDRNDATSEKLAGVLFADGGQSGEQPYSVARGTSRAAGTGALAHSQSAKTAAFTEGITKAFADAAPMIGGPAVGKALINSGSITSEFSGAIIAEPTPQYHLLSAIPSDRVDSAKGSYLQQTVRTNNATTVERHGLKPTSIFTLTPKDWEIATVAHLTEPIARQHLEDYTGLTDFISAELAHGLSAAVSSFVLNGGTAESGTAVQGILGSGVQEVVYATSAARTIRKSITALESSGVAPSHIVLGPEEWEEIEATLSQDAWAVGGTPQNRAAAKLWGVPVVVDPTMPAGKALVGDLNTINLLHRSTLRVDWSEASANQGTAATPKMRDLFRHNELVFRGEVRVGLMVASPPSLRIADLTAA